MNEVVCIENGFNDNDCEENSPLTAKECLAISQEHHDEHDFN